MSRGRNSKKRNYHQGSGFEEWGGYWEAKKQKLQEQFNTENEGSSIFKGVAVYINGYTKPSSDELRMLLTQHGGRFEQYLYKRRVTHIVATNLPDSKIVSLKGMKVVKPDWITDSVAAGRLLPYTSYLLYGKSSKKLTTFGRTVTHSTKPSTSSALDSVSSHSVDDKCPEFSLDFSKPDTSVNTTVINSVTANDKRPDMLLSEISSDFSKLGTSEDVTVINLETENDKKTDFIHSEFSERENQDEESESFQHATANSPDFSNTSNHSGKTTSVNQDKGGNKVNRVTSESETVEQKNKCLRASATASDPGFVAEFYSHSRLHHISTSGAQFKEYVSKLQKQSDGSFPGREKLRQLHLTRLEQTGSVEQARRPVHGRPEKVIMHVDMDCFFVSVGLRDRPELVGKPVAVTHSKGKGVSRGGTSEAGDGEFSSMAEIASCSYEARKAGVKNGMFMGPARTLCPDLIPIPYEFDKYQQVSQTLYDTVASYTHDIEAVSCDEMLIDCTDLLAGTGASPLDFATMLRNDIKTKTGCNASAGIASSILLARLATRTAKPNGQFCLDAGDVTDFMSKQLVKDLPGVGWSMMRKLSSLNVKTCGDLQKLALVTLQKEFGQKTGQNLYKFCRGEDFRQIRVDLERKSVSAEINYGIRFQKDTEAVKFIEELAEEVCARLKQVKRKGKTVTLKLMIRRSDAPKEAPKYLGHGKCTCFSKSTTLPVSTEDPVTVSRLCVNILKSQQIDCTDIRGVGIQIHRLESCTLAPVLPKSNQSILSFTHKITSSTTASSKSQNTHTTTTSTVTESTTDRENLRKSISEEKPAQSVSIPDDNDVSLLGNDDDDVDAVDDGSTSFRCTNKTIMEELSRRQTAKLIPPPLPTLPDLIVSPEPRRPETVHSKDYFPSPSQIDPEVLKELPADIRQQIEKDIKLRQCEKNREKKPRGSSQEAGCSHWPEPATDVTNQEASVSKQPHPHSDNIEKSSNAGFGALPSPSQLDLSCLNALPEELQKEIRHGYAQQNRTISENSSPQKLNTLQLKQATSPSRKKTSPSKKRSPAKVTSPGKRKRNSPQFKVPQNRPGRKKKTSAKKLEFSKKPQTVVVVEDRTDSEEVTDKSVHTHTEESVEQTVNLCGAVTIQQVRNLLDEWLQSSPVPQEDDVNEMISYLGQLVEDRNLEMVDLVLKTLHRKTRKAENKLWRNSFEKVLNNTQNIVFAYYNSYLKTDWLKTF